LYDNDLLLLPTLRMRNPLGGVFRDGICLCMGLYDLQHIFEDAHSMDANVFASDGL
jgi:hypothetical protein